MSKSYFYKLSDPDFYLKRKEACIQGFGIVYVVRCLSENAKSNNGPYISISRVLEVDNSGILYIGEGSGESRLARLIESIHPSYSGRNHNFGSYYRSEARFHSKFPFEDLVIEIIPSKDHKGEEKKKIEQYRTQFGELPPFNLKR